MKHYIQTVFGRGRGSCTATAIACVLDLEQDDVPNFAAFGRLRWIDALAMWCEAQKIHGRYLHASDGDPAPGTLTVASGFGPRYGCIECRWFGLPNETVLDEKGCPRCPRCNTVPAPIRHSTVWQDGKTVHDPHPSGQGLAYPPDGWWIFERCPQDGCGQCGLPGATRERRLRAEALLEEHGVAGGANIENHGATVVPGGDASAARPSEPAGA